MQRRQNNILTKTSLLSRVSRALFVPCCDMFRRGSPWICYLSLSVFSVFFIPAFSSHAAMLSPGDRSVIQQQQQQLLDENQRQRDALERSAPLTITPSPETSAGTEGPCFTVSRIVVSGATRLASAETDRLVAPWVNQCLNITGLTAVTNAVTDGYIRRGYITSRAFLTEQDLSGGVLHITVMEGRLQALEVTEGSITINGAGLDGTRSDAVSIIARATEVNAALHAKDLTVTAGANRVTADGRVSTLNGEGNVPKVAVDTGALGGMYARRIHLTSTESGVGVNLGNLYARDGDITLDASGRLTVNNSLATGAVTAKGQGVTLTGDHKAGGNLSVSSRSDIVLSNGTLNSDKDLSLTAGGRITQQNEKLTAGRDVTLAAKNITQDTASQINAARDIVTVASDTLTTQGQITAGQNLTASATTLTQDGILLAKGHAGLDAGTLNNSGSVQGASLMPGSTTLSNSGSLLSGSRLTVNTHEFNQSGRTGAKGKVDIMASGKLTSTGLLVSDDALVLKAQDVTQNGVLSGGKGLTVSAQALSSGKNRSPTAGKAAPRRSASVRRN